MNIIKSNTYTLVNTNPFDMPLPLSFELWNSDVRLATYNINEYGEIEYTFNQDTDCKILTSTSRKLTMNDIYFLLSARVFSDKSSDAQYRLYFLGLTAYNPYHIIRCTHGILPTDTYWIKFSDENLSFSQAICDMQSRTQTPYYPSHEKAQ